MWIKYQSLAKTENIYSKEQVFDTKTTPLLDKSNKNLIQNLIKISDKINSNENKLQKSKSLENSSQINYIKCCENNISKISENDKKK